MRFITVMALAMLLAVVAAGGALATELRYEPTNPSFGGNPLNGSFLLNKAQVQNGFEGDGFDFDDDPLADFEETLVRRLLSGLASQITESIFGEEELPDGPIAVGDLQIEVIQGGGDLGQDVIEITNLLTGELTTIVVPVSGL
jgi:curli production assembly/transport component CsgF